MKSTINGNFETSYMIFRETPLVSLFTSKIAGNSMIATVYARRTLDYEDSKRHFLILLGRARVEVWQLSIH
jgi:hypothetical protein